MVKGKKLLAIGKCLKLSYPKKCKTCGLAFDGAAPNSKYCPNCSPSIKYKGKG